MEIPEHFTALSIRMSEALDDSGAGKHTIMERRRTFMWRESMEMILYQANGINNECFHFGSQSEGTTTPGLNSDIDFLISCNKVNTMAVWGDWEAGMWNLLMLQEEDINPPQQYLLQYFRKYTPEPETLLLHDQYVMKDTVQVLLSSERWKQDIEFHHKDHGEVHVTKCGPSVSCIPNWDVVFAIPVCKPLPEIQHWIDRCRGRHWPPVQLLEAAQVAPCFLVPAGHPDSDYKREEWRVSPNLIERMLMFSFNMTQIRCYIVLKLIKKSLFAKIVGDSLTSFHCKTIMFYCIERTQPSLWFEHNLMFLLRFCLHVLKKCLQMGRLPHYIIEGVNLFDGKLSKVKQRRLLVYIDSMIRSNLQDVFYIGIDTLGCRLQACGILRIGQDVELGRACLRNSISLLLKFECLNSFLGVITDQMKRFNTNFDKTIQNKLRNVFEYSTNVRLKSVVLEFVKNLFSLQNSMQSSYILRLRNSVYNELIRRFQYSLQTDVASKRLKLASLLYASGHLHSAVRVLEDVEKRYHRKVKSVCSCRHIKGDCDLQVFASMKLEKCDNVFNEPPFAFCVMFVRQEMYCAPYILWFEMNRNIAEEEVAQRNPLEKQWMDRAEVDARPFLYYLQYLTYGGLGERYKQLHAMEELDSYTCIGDEMRMINLYHPETSLNLLGHCYEMEGNFQGALHYYEESLSWAGTNNAANWHVQRVQRLISI
ncbi:uncharacterized protein LOC127858456 isoform X1 [Dreissena polymorpha]|uniref:uncharacterized protein LOC127858456 isoform X1 n=1 Tax=Dreissena polymorpha TaxID=45954 RepID=UPI0022656681|nr:uncharacterized protein LOC127858456 isoform X1 [Dreissena polymorpha]